MYLPVNLTRCGVGSNPYIDELRFVLEPNLLMGCVAMVPGVKFETSTTVCMLGCLCVSAAELSRSKLNYTCAKAETQSEVGRERGGAVVVIVGVVSYVFVATTSARNGDVSLRQLGKGM